MVYTMGKVYVQWQLYNQRLVQWEAFPADMPTTHSLCTWCLMAGTDLQVTPLIVYID